MTRLELRFLGGLTLHQDGQPLTTLKSQKGQALLCYLALTGKAQPRPVLAGLLWPEMPEENALMNLRVTLKKLNEHLDPHLTAIRQSIAFNQDAPYWLDVAEFEAGLAVKADIGRLQTAVTLYQGDFLDGFYLDDAPEFEGWVLRQRAHLRQTALDTLQHLVAHFADRGIYETAVTYARQLLTIEPWQEEAHRQLMRLLALSGQRSAALTQYETCRQHLQDELDVEPSAETQALYKAIRAGQLNKAAADTEAVRELLPPPQLATNLPALLTSFIGRQTEIAHLQKQLLNPANRLVTLTGPGGTGKTRLSLETAGTLLDAFVDGVWLVELAPLADPVFVVNAVAAVFELRDEGGRPLATVLTDYLQTKHLLLILDNCEHLIESCARLAQSLLESCPHLTILTTSREALGMSGEVIVRVPPLAVPDPEQTISLATLAEVEAVQLFVERAKAALSDFSLTERNDTAVTQVCQRLDGIPLAIELAAARVKLLQAEQIARRLDDRFRLLTGGSRTALPRQRTLQATIDWSYDLLPEAEQQLLQRLSVFAGGWTLEAAEAVCADEDIGEYEILDLLTQLVNKSLVLAEREPGRETRYRLLETIRQYASERLTESGEMKTMWQRHAAFFVSLAEEAESKLNGAEKLTWLNYLETDLNNIQTVLERATKDQLQDVEAGLRLVGSLEEFWMVRHPWEGVKWLEALLEKRDQISLPVRARIALTAGILFRWEGVEGAINLINESLSLYQQIQNKEGIARTLLYLGSDALWPNKDYERSAVLFEQSLILFRELGDALGIANVLFSLGSVAYSQHDYEQAATLYEQALPLFQKAGNEHRIAQLSVSLGGLALDKKEFTQAITFMTKSLTIARKLNDKDLMANSLNSLGVIARLQGDYERAATLYEESLALWREVDEERGMFMTLSNLGYVVLHQGAIQRAKLLFREVLTPRRMLAHSIRDRIYYLVGPAAVAGQSGELERAARLFGAITALLEANDEQLYIFLQMEYELYLTAVRTQLDETTFNKAWVEGQAMSLDEAIALALEEESEQAD